MNYKNLGECWSRRRCRDRQEQGFAALLYSKPSENSLKRRRRER